MSGTGSGTYWTFDDNLGSPVVQSDSSGTVKWQAEYTPNGEVFQLPVGTGLHQPLRYPGQEAEQFAGNGANGDTTRYYNINRWYRPHWARYTQTDPLGQLGGMPAPAPRGWAAQINPYEYAANDPVRFYDSSGLFLNVPQDPLGNSGQSLSSLFCNLSRRSSLFNLFGQQLMADPNQWNIVSGSYNGIDVGNLQVTINVTGAEQNGDLSNAYAGLAHEMAHAASYSNNAYEYFASTDTTWGSGNTGGYGQESQNLQENWGSIAEHQVLSQAGMAQFWSAPPYAYGVNFGGFMNQAAPWWSQLTSHSLSAFFDYWNDRLGTNGRQGGGSNSGCSCR